MKTLPKEQAQEEVKDGLVTKFKVAEGWWECDICMVRNDSDKVECAPCKSFKPVAEPRQGQKKVVEKSFSLRSSTPLSDSVSLFASSALRTGLWFSFNQTPSSDTGACFSKAPVT